MDQDEYKLMEFTYSDEEKTKVDEYNKERVKKALELLVYNRKRLLDDDAYFKMPIEERINIIQGLEDYQAFCSEYPVVSKYIIAYGLFSSKAFKKYVDWKCKLRPSDKIRSKLAGNQREQEHFKNKYIYAVYVKFLYADKNPRAGLKEINSVYLETVEALNKESDEFFDMYESAKQETETKESLDKQERLNRIKSQLQKKIAMN